MPYITSFKEFRLGLLWASGLPRFGVLESSLQAEALGMRVVVGTHQDCVLASHKGYMGDNGKKMETTISCIGVIWDNGK